MKRKKLRSKRGVTLVEVIVGVTIVAIVFSSTLGAMVGGYTTTLRNAESNKNSVKNTSINEVLNVSLANLHLTSEDTEEVDEICSGDDTSEEFKMLKEAAESLDSKATFIEYDNFPKLEPAEGVENDVVPTFQYTFFTVGDDTGVVDPESSKPVYDTTLKTDGSDVKIKGIVLKTCAISSSGPLFFESFVSYVMPEDG